MSDSTKPLILVDGSSYLFRAFYALPPLTNSEGMPTGAIYGVLNMIRRLMREYTPSYIAVVFDPKGKTFRNDLYEAYKANRTKMPDDLSVQIAPLHEAIQALGLPLIVVDGVEADDVIGTLAKQAEAVGMQTIISTGDKDMAQLVNEHVTLINTMNNTTLQTAQVKEKFGVLPQQMIDYLALVGDTVDNVPGVPKVGPKTAVKWLDAYGSLDEIMAHADQITGKVGENLRESLPQLPLSRELVTIKTDVTLPFKPVDLKLTPPKKSTLLNLFKTLEFKNWLQELTNDEALSQEQKPVSYHVLLSESAFKEWLAKLHAAKVFSFDTETTSLDAMRAELVGVSFSVAPDEAAYVPLGHDYTDVPIQLDKAMVCDALAPILLDQQKTIIGQNLKYDIKILRNQGLEMGAHLRDTMLESYVLNSTSARHDMDTLAMKYLAKNTIKFEDIAGKGAKQLTFNQVLIEDAGPYAAEDADVTMALDQKLFPTITEQPSLKKVFEEIEMPLMPILADMEYRGVLIDTQMLVSQSKDIEKQLKQIQKKIYKLADEEFNIDSPKQLQDILYNKLKLPILKKTPKGQPSTAEPVLQELALDFPMPEWILSYRSLAKLKSTYTDKLPEMVNPKTGRVHTHYNQAVTATGRLSSRDPNLQNIPVRSEMGRKIRQAFVAPPGYKILAADYSQIELRIMAHLSQDPTLIKAFSNNHDVHSATAAEVFGVSLDAVTSEQRRRAKAINFGLMYGMSAYGLSRQLNIPRSDAQEYIDVYFHRYPKVQAYMTQAREKAAEQGYVETLYGRRLYVPEIHSTNTQRRMAAERQAINAPLQGSAADIIKVAMICIAKWLKASQFNVNMIMQVHDELVFEVDETILEAATKGIQACMETSSQLTVPLSVAIGVGVNWDEAH